MASVSRRTLLASTSFAALAFFVKPIASSAAFGSKQRLGRINLGLNGLTASMGFYSFLNAWKQSDPIEIVCNGIHYSGQVPSGRPFSAWDGFLDSNGELVAPLPQGVTI